MNRAGSSTALAAVAERFKSVTAAPYLCHLAGIALLASGHARLGTRALRPLLWSPVGSARGGDHGGNV